MFDPDGYPSHTRDIDPHDIKSDLWHTELLLLDQQRSFDEEQASGHAIRSSASQHPGREFLGETFALTTTAGALALAALRTTKAAVKLTRAAIKGSIKHDR
jgi:hypothetical protein